MSKSGTQEFTSSWAKTVNWAKQSGIPQSAYYPVYQMDSQRLLQGDPMSESERIRAIQAASGLNYSNALPTDAQSPLNVVGNVKSNAANIFTGLNPVSLVKNIFDTVTNSIEHPSSVYGIFETKSSGFNPGELAANMDKYVLSPHSIWSWVPGLADVAELFQGKKGLQNLADNPLTSLLDVLPLADSIPKVLSSVDASGTPLFESGQAIANRLGVSLEELGKMSPQKLAWALARTSSKGLSPALLAATKDAAGQEAITPFTWGDRIDAFRNAHGIGSIQSKNQGGLITAEQKGTRQVEALVKPAIDAIGHLSKPMQAIATRIAQTDFRPPEEIMNDDSIPIPVREALDKALGASRQLKQLKMQAGTMETIHTAVLDKDGNVAEVDEDYLIGPGSRGEKVSKALAKSKAAQDALDQASKKFDYLLMKVDDSDKLLNQFVQQLKGTSGAIYDSIKASIPDLPDSAAERARNTLPIAERWDRAVPTNTIVLRNLLGLGPDDVISLHSMNAIRDLFQPNGLNDQVYKAYEDQDWQSLSKYSSVAARKFDNKVFNNLPGGPQGHLLQVRNLIKGLHSFSVQRAKIMEEIDKIWSGTYRGSRMAKGKYRNSVSFLTQAASKAHQDFIDTAIKNPPDVWDSAYLTELTNQITTSEKTADLIPKVVAALKSENEWPDDELDKLRADPRTIVEIASRSSKDSYGNPMLPDIPINLWKEMSDNAYRELSSLRARGLVPHYIPRLNPNEINEDVSPTYNMHLSVLRPVNEAATSSRVFDYKPSVFDIQLGLLKGGKEALRDDVLQGFHEEYIKPLLHPAGDVNAILRNRLSSEIAMNAVRNVTGEGVDSTDAIIQRGIKNMNLVTWEPEKIFGNLAGPKLDADYYINGDIADALQKQVNKFSMPAKGFFDKGTRVFRMSILGLSPRFTAHILFGGTYLVGLRAHPGMVSFLRDAVHYGRTGDFTPDTLARYPRIAEGIGHSSTQEGMEDITFHYLAGRQQGDTVIQEYLAQHPNLQGAIGHLKAAANINFRFTRAITRAQKAVVYLDGAARAEKSGSFYDDVYTPQKDINGNDMYNPVTGKQMFTVSREKIDMTPEQIHEEGMQAVSEVMGDLRKMTPLERNVLLKAFPFYGWTKHILSYVLTYPEDHPYRAMFLSQLATQNSADVASGLPTRIQLLFFLGQPDAQGNVSAVDDRFMDPLRDVANYASWTGLFESLNPILSAPLAAVDPNISFGGVSLYPNVTYDSLYGTKEAGAQGNSWNSIEQVVPEVSALDAAFNLSGQYSYLKQNNPEGFAKKIFESLNIPFAQIQHINLRQISAQDEMDRYSEAENDAYNALNSGDFSTLDKYPAGATVPDPMGTGYNVTVAFLKALYNETEKRFGLPPTEALPQLPTPQI